MERTGGTYTNGVETYRKGGWWCARYRLNLNNSPLCIVLTVESEKTEDAALQAIEAAANTLTTFKVSLHRDISIRNPDYPLNS